MNATISRAVRCAAVSAMLLLSACATTSPAYHKYVMQGQVLSVDGKTVTVCIGESEGAQVGQVLDLVRHVPGQAGPKGHGPTFKRIDVGAVRIASVFDEHYAKAEVLEGQANVSDTVELRAP